MKVGDYVRIKWGNGLQTISKCKNIVNMGDTQYAKDDYYIHTDLSGEVIYKTMIIKSSPNIIDLIEVGDYVNGYKVKEIIVWIDGTKSLKLENYGAYQVFVTDIKSIVTKEMFANAEYKVEE